MAIESCRSFRRGKKRTYSGFCERMEIIMFQKKERSFVSKDAKKHIIILGIVLFAAIILIAIISLLPNRMPQLGNTDRNGVARNF